MPRRYYGDMKKKKAPERVPEPDSFEEKLDTGEEDADADDEPDMDTDDDEMEYDEESAHVAPKKKKRMSKKKRAIISVLVFLILSCVVFFVLFVTLYSADARRHLKWDNISDIAHSVPSSGSAVSAESEEKKTKKKANKATDRGINWDDLWKINKDIVAWIYIPHTNIDYPILQEKTVGKYYYLHHDIYGNYDANGCILTPAIPHNAEDMHFLVFGHHMNSGAMFGRLEAEFKTKSGYNEHPKVYIYKPDRVETWDVWSTYNTDVEDMIYDIPFDRGSDYYTKLINRIERKKAYSTAHKLQNITNLDHTMTLSTCSGTAGGDLRYTVSCTLRSIKWLKDGAKAEYEKSEKEKNNKVLGIKEPEPTKAPSQNNGNSSSGSNNSTAGSSSGSKKNAGVSESSDGGFVISD